MNDPSKKNTRKQFVADLACFCLFPGKHLNWAWMKPIFVRNTIITAVTCGFWDWFLYFSPLKDKLHKYKVSKKNESKGFLCKHKTLFVALSLYWSLIIWAKDL
jgi:hypothetical protein